MIIIGIGSMMVAAGMLAGGVPGAVMAGAGVLVMFAHALQ